MTTNVVLVLVGAWCCCCYLISNLLRLLHFVTDRRQTSHTHMLRCVAGNKGCNLFLMISCWKTKLLPKIRRVIKQTAKPLQRLQWFLILQSIRLSLTAIFLISFLLLLVTAILFPLSSVSLTACPSHCAKTTKRFVWTISTDFKFSPELFLQVDFYGRASAMLRRWLFCFAMSFISEFLFSV